MQVLHLQVKGRIPSKKNNKVWTGKYLVSSANYKKWEASAIEQLAKHRDLFIEKAEIQMEIFWPDKRSADLTNKAESIMDMLVQANIIKDDNWKVIDSVYLRSGGLDRKNPRVDIWIKEIKNET
jgi:Holliday junction resolvase RusA-like endonuclease